MEPREEELPGRLAALLDDRVSQEPPPPSIDEVVRGCDADFQRYTRRRKIGLVAGALGAASVAVTSAMWVGMLKPASEMTAGTQASDVAICPSRLPQATVESHGLGTSEPATTSPVFPTIDSAWVCTYNAVSVGPGPNGTGTTFGWFQYGEVQPVPRAALSQLQQHLDRLEPAPSDRMCTSELGARWMLVVADEGQVTGLVVDGYGCHEVRLTDDPLEEVPGQAARAGLVAGVLVGPDALLAALQDVERG